MMILITGASGNVGSEVLRQAAAAGLQVRAAYQSADKAKAAPPGVATVLMDYSQPETVRAALRDIERVFLVGPPAANVAEMEANLVREAKRSETRHIVKLSAMGGRKATFPSLHRDSEENIEASGIAYTFLRPNGFMQNFVNFNAPTIKSQNAFYAAQGNGAVSHIDIRDIGACGKGPGGNRPRAQSVHLDRTRSADQLADCGEAVTSDRTPDSICRSPAIRHEEGVARGRSTGVVRGCALEPTSSLQSGGSKPGRSDTGTIDRKEGDLLRSVRARLCVGFLS